ncbi:putative arrestin-related trafficking adapter [Paramyrothecium foliicola]|nr:putative arrestin-related trafficking adapter [Paramyrothecium foliicola]
MPEQQRERRRNQQQPNQQPSSWVTVDGGHVFYRAYSRTAEKQKLNRFPTPLIGPRRSRPHAIHIVTFPSGYVPRDLRENANCDAKKKKQQKGLTSRRSQSQPPEGAGTRANLKDRFRQRRQRRQQSDATPAAAATALLPSYRERERDYSPTLRPVLGKIFGSTFSSAQSAESGSPPSPATLTTTASIQAAAAPAPTSTTTSGLAGTGITGITGTCTGQTGVPQPPATYDAIAQESLQDPPAQFQSRSNPAQHPRDPLHHSQHRHHHPHRRQNSLPVDLHALPESADPSDICPYPQPQPRPRDHSLLVQQHQRQRDSILSVYDGPSLNTLARSSSGAAAALPSMTARIVPPPSTLNLGFGSGLTSSNSFVSSRANKPSVNSVVSEVPKPVASGSGVSCSILLAEPNVFLSGFDHDHHSRHQGQGGTALLRGRLRLSVSKNVKIKAVQLKLLGRARTEWPEGIPPLKQDVYEEESLRTQVLTFFNAMYDGWETDYGNQCTYKLKNSSANSSSTNLANRQGLPPTTFSTSTMTAKELKRLSLQSVQSRSFNKSDSGSSTSIAQAKGFKVFYPGIYDYSFELPIDHHQLETTKLQYGSVRWELQATVDRAGAFKPNLHGTKEVNIIRVPDQLSLEMSEPISISRRWEDQLHYDIIISGKSFPIGGKIPIAFKLTPLAKVQVHKLKVFVTESIEYWTNDRRVTRKDSGRKILLLEKAAGKPLDESWASSELRTIRGGELTPQQRREAREMATQRRQAEASRRQQNPEPLPAPSENLLGDIDLGLESYWGSTEIEANVQIPTCEMMAKNKALILNPDCSWKNVNVYHWIKIVLRISRLDPEDPTGTKRRHFEISIDSPFTVLNCRAIQSNTNLPAYSGPVSQPSPLQSACGCPDARSFAMGPSPSSSTGTLPDVDNVNDALPAPPQAAHVHHGGLHPSSGGSQSPAPAEGLGIQADPRPIHLLRVPSFNPPAFDEDTAPPPPPELVAENPDAANAPIMTPPPCYDVVVGTPSVDGLADYFTRLANYDEGTEEDSGSDADEPLRILDRTGRVNVVHPRTPGGRMPSRSLEISRPPINLHLDNRQSINGTT